LAQDLILSAFLGHSIHEFISESELSGQWISIFLYTIIPQITPVIRGALGFILARSRNLKVTFSIDTQQSSIHQSRKPSNTPDAIRFGPDLSRPLSPTLNRKITEA